LAILVAVGDVEYSGMYFGRFEEKYPTPRRLDAWFREHAASTDSGLILDWLHKADIAFANLETTLAAPKPYYHPRPSTYRFRADPSSAEDLRSLGFGLVSLANNHVFDYGESAFVETLEALNGAGIEHVGAGLNLEKALSPVVMDAGGQRVAFLGFATVYPLVGAASHDRPGIAAIRNKIVYEFESFRLPTDLRPGYASLPVIREEPVEQDVIRVQECIRNAKASVDYVVVSVHWGKEYEDVPSNGQRELGHRMVEAGADLVVGHHPHTAQAIEAYKEGYIFYSLGNFAMQVEWDIARCEVYMNEAFMLRVEVDDGKAKRVEMLPTRTDRTGLPMITEDHANVVRHLSEISRPLNASLTPHKQGALIKPPT